MRIMETIMIRDSCVTHSLLETTPIKIFNKNNHNHVRVAGPTVHRIQQVEQYLDVALEQAKDFDHEKGVMKLSGSMQDDPCAARKGARPGDPFWCLCNKHGHKIEWEEGDSPAAEAVLEGPKKGNATNGASVDDRAEIALFHSRCNNKKEPKSFRHKSCHWQGNATHGGCCSKKEGCTHDVTPDLDRA